ncbi:iron-sulfur cluster insertion protein ErpA [Thalassospira alkalitolerans]|uniref:Heme biosynthesis protein HemY n=1 Tax=Thalassospira alkalitolerans TaxID=1293890 RepID=A0A1Y2L761_9PROT|nr:iron-sulfur cluster insertion protein ErpA [Thalassospira alkalitolerans]OSQ43558.1 heme biosynthesis protein HemY [Thalassospira alkalitolerans]|tara:strand:+ start:28875 stop:29216 length:342 start_codon:yes stop_codon:yes gene_type:complete
MTETSRQVQMTESAAKRIQELIASNGTSDLMLRLQVSGGGCSGFQYEFSLDSDKTDEDNIFENHGAKMVIDDVSLDLLGGAEIDFVRELVGAAFRVNNPNATSSCGCGSSFSV